MAAYLDMLAAVGGAARNTLEAYRRDLEDYLGHLADEGVDPAEVEAGTVRAYIAGLETRGLKSSSAARRLSCIRGFHKFLYAEGMAETDPSAPLTGPRRGRTLPKILSVQEVDRLLAVAREQVTTAMGKGRTEGTREGKNEGMGHEPRAQAARARRMLCLIELLY
ncbi:MAG TPA: site-specific integrase, partial [Methylobacterium sp.]|nr:site-specific integrase [Methylobacterium sp.]